MQTITANDIETPATTTPIQEACNVNLDETNDEDVVVSDVENAVVTVAENDAHITAGAVESNKTGSATSPTVIEYGIDYFYSEDCNEENDMVRLPLGCKNGDRLVPGVCAICLCPYVDGNQVSWSPDNPCQHAFHTDCIISWLAKKEEPQCPVCRQEFCAAVPMSAEEEDVIEVDLEREAAFLESFSQALAISQLYRPYSSTDDAAAGGHSSSRLSSRDHPLGSRANALQLTNIAMQQRLEMAGFQARHHQQQQQQRRALDSTNAAATADSNDWPVGIIPPALAESPTLPNPNANSSEQVGQNAAPASNDGTPADDNVETGLGSRVSQSQ